MVRWYLSACYSGLISSIPIPVKDVVYAIPYSYLDGPGLSLSFYEKPGLSLSRIREVTGEGLGSPTWRPVRGKLRVSACPGSWHGLHNCQADREHVARANSALL